MLECGAGVPVVAGGDGRRGDGGGRAAGRLAREVRPMARALLLAAVVAAAAALCPPGPPGAPGALPAPHGGAAGCACGDGGTRLDCRGAGLRRLPPLHENLLSL